MKLNDFKLSPNFNLSEFQCPHCQCVKLNPMVVIYLQAVRIYYGDPIYVTSGYRCKSHNEAIGGEPDSRHLYGEAVDLSLDNPIPDRLEILGNCCKTAGFKYVKVDTKKKYVHCQLYLKGA